MLIELKFHRVSSELPFLHLGLERSKMKIWLLQCLFLLASQTEKTSSSPVSLQVNEIYRYKVFERRKRDVECSNGEQDTPGCGTNQENDEYLKPRILSLRVNTSITARYVSTTVVKTIQNRALVSQDTTFRFRLSEESFISDFFMVVDDEIYQSEVQEKEAAQKAYDKAKERGQTTSQVRQSDSDSNTFVTDVNLSPNTTASFHLTFQEHLNRKHGVFQHRINLFPKEIVQDLIADVYITEPQGISFVNITWEQENVTTVFLRNTISVDRKSDTEVQGRFIPSLMDQRDLSEIGLEGDLVITYDVVHDSGAGSIEVVNGYFVHHISPVNLPITRKNVVFVIDTSGSMSGNKLAQTKVAMATIIDDVRDFDRFNIISFNSGTMQWKSHLVDATAANKHAAKEYVNGLTASGGTDIQGSLSLAVSFLQHLGRTESSDALSMIIFLTDGQPTSGETNRNVIVTSITEAIQGKFALFSLAFGFDADYKLLEKLSGHNQGVARQIYEDSSASLQLEGFYDEISTPLLHHITVRYSEEKVDVGSLTQTNFISYFEGTELVVAGKLTDSFTGNEISAVVSANSFDATVEWELTKQVAESGHDAEVIDTRKVHDFAQRLWAYVTIKDLLSKRDIALTEEEKNLVTDRALALALKYKFVTPLTSLIVIKPNETIFPSSSGEPQDDSGQWVSSGRPMSGVFGDPHIVVQDPLSEVRLCFDVHGPQGTVISLFEDPKLGVTVNGKMVLKENYTSPDPTKKPPSYIGEVAVQLGGDWITVSRDHLTIHGEFPQPWVPHFEINAGSCKLEMITDAIEISCKNGVVMKIQRHHISGGKYDHFDVSLGEGHVFSESVHGIVGQFHWKRITLQESSVDLVTTPGKARAVLLINGEKLKVSESTRPLTGTCWGSSVKNVLTKINSTYEDFILPRLFSKLSA